MRLVTILISLALLITIEVRAQENEFSFDLQEFEPKPFQLTGSFGVLSGFGEVNKDGALYQLEFLDTDPDRLESHTATLELSGHYQDEGLSFDFLTHSEIFYDFRGQEEENDLYEAYFGFQSSPAFRFDLGKKSMRWGKGYTWNPVAFVERTKDAGDPELAREGYWIAATDSIFSFDHDLQTLAVTLLVLPVHEDINSDFIEAQSSQPGSDDCLIDEVTNTELDEAEHVYLAGKLHLLYRDTDIDFMFLSAGARGPQLGMDFSRNLAPNFEIHGEWAYFADTPQRTITDDCQSGPILTDDEIAFLLGLKYRTSNDITFIWEYYYNGRGNSKTEQQKFFQCIQDAADANDLNSLDELPISKDLETGPFSRPNPMQEYMTLRALWEEPNDILYLSAGLQILYNIQDESYSISPEVFYDKFENIELRIRTTFPEGDPLTEWGEKPNDYKIETEFVYYF